MRKIQVLLLECVCVLVVTLQECVCMRVVCLHSGVILLPQVRPARVFVHFHFA
jgi:hypothetical protein